MKSAVTDSLLKVLGSIPIVIDPTKMDVNILGLVIGAMPHILQMIVTRNPITGLFEIKFKVAGSGLTTGSYLQDIQMATNGTASVIGVTGRWEKDNRGWRYFQDGYLKNSWLKSDGKWYYLNTEGYMTTGWCDIDGERYYFRKDGHMVSGGWKHTDESDKYWYYFYDDGKMASDEILSWQGKKYYLYPQGILATNQDIEFKGVLYSANGDGELTEKSKDMTVSQEYIGFVIEYEGGNAGTKWQYAQDLGDGVITVGFGVVIKNRIGKYPLGKAKYDELMDLKNNQIPLTWNEALDLTMEYMENEYSVKVNEKAKAKGWILDQNRFDALVDMVWNCGEISLTYKSCEYLATGNLNDPNIMLQLKKEITETAHMEINGVNQWTKNLVERRADVIRIAQGGSDAYTRNEFTKQHWNQNAYTILLNMGLDPQTINKFPIQRL